MKGFDEWLDNYGDPDPSGTDDELADCNDELSNSKGMCE